jgi:putative PIN family toxin of toxin-antitoxin system
MLRVVIDTNIIVSGILSHHGAPALVLDAWRDRLFLMISSPAIVTEVKSVLQYDRIRNKYKLTDEEIDQIVSLIEHDALLVPGMADVAGSIPADPMDEIVLACAVDGQADLIVSGDHHLLDLGAYRNTRIVSARQFLELLKANL